MNTETALKDALTAEAGTLGVTEDPWPRFEKRERTHRRRRRTRIAGVAVVVAAALGVQAGVVPLPGFVPGIAITGFGETALTESPIRGSLAGDQAFLDGMRGAVKDIEDPGEVWRITDRNKIKFLYAADVAGHRLVLAHVPLRYGFLDDEALVWYDGEAGDAPDRMTEGGRSDGGETVMTYQQESAEKPGILVVVAPAGSTVAVSNGFRYTAEGRLEYNPAQVQQAGTGLTELTTPPAPLPGTTTIKVTSGDTTLYDGSAGGGWSGSSEKNPQDAPASLITLALGDRTFDHDTLQRWVSSALSDARLPAAGIVLSIRWTGTVNGQPAALFTIRPPGGGVLAYAMHGSADSYRQDLRLLLPEAGAATRPIAWRIRAEGKDDRTGQVIAVGPAGTKKLVLQANGDAAVTLTPDATGAAVGSVPPVAGATVTAFDGDGRELGRTPVAPFEDNSGGLPGADMKTRIVE